MMSAPLDFQIGTVGVVTTHNRGHSAEELAEMAVNKIISIGDDAPEPLRAQALAYRENMRSIILLYLRRAMNSERATIRGEIAAEMKDTR